MVEVPQPCPGVRFYKTLDSLRFQRTSSPAPQSENTSVSYAASRKMNAETGTRRLTCVYNDVPKLRPKLQYNNTLKYKNGTKTS